MPDFNSMNGHGGQGGGDRFKTTDIPLGKPGIRCQKIELATATPEESVSLDDFLAYMPSYTYIFRPTRDMWPAKSVNARVAPIPIIGASGHPVMDENGKQKTMAASAWLDRHQPVEQMDMGARP